MEFEKNNTGILSILIAKAKYPAEVAPEYIVKKYNGI